MANQPVTGSTLRDRLKARRNDYLERITRWERARNSDGAVVQIRRRFAGSTEVPLEAPFDSPERKAMDDRYGGDDRVTSYADWEALKIVRNELNLNRLTAWLVWLKERSAKDERIVESDLNPFRTELLPGENPLFGVLPPPTHLPPLDKPVGFGGVVCALRRCGAGLPSPTLAAIFQVMGGVPTLKLRALSPSQSDEVQEVMPVDDLAEDLDKVIRDFEVSQALRKPAYRDLNLAATIAGILATKGAQPTPEELFVAGRSFADAETLFETADAAWGDGAQCLLNDLSVNLSPRTIASLLDWLSKVYAGLKAQSGGQVTVSGPSNGFEPPMRSGWEQPPIGGWERPPATGRDPASAAPDRRRDWASAVSAIAALASLGQMNRASFGDAIQSLCRLTLVQVGWPADLVEEWLKKAVARRGFPLRAAALLEFPGIYAEHIHPLDIDFPDYTPLGACWCSHVLIPSTMGHILALKDTADFHVTDHLRFIYLFERKKLLTSAGVLPPEIRPFFEAALLRFKYWIEDAHSKAAEEMTFWSENHQVQFASSEYLAGQLWAAAEFQYPNGDGEKHDGAWHRERAKKRLERWLGERMKLGFSEWNAPGYYNEDVPPLMNLIDFCDDAELVAMALTVADLIVFDVARFTCQGNFCVTAGRAYHEHKRVAWDQSIGDFIEILFGTRGDVLAPNETTAIALATSSYVDQVPEALLAIGQDRPRIFLDNSRVSTDLVPRDGGADGADIVFAWGLSGYFTLTTYDDTVKWADKWGLFGTGPFKALKLTGDNHWESLGLALAGAGGSARLLAIGQVLPFPINIVFIAASVPGVIRGFVDVVLAGVDLVLEFAEDVWDGVIELFGGDTDDDDAPRLSRPAVLELYKRLLIEFNSGSLLTTARLRTFRTPDVMLSSAVHHRPGEIAFQKQSCCAAVGQNVSVWTTKPLGQASTGAGVLRGVEEFVEQTPVTWATTLAFPWAGRPYDGLADVVLPFVKDSFMGGGHDGPNWWTGTATLPDVWQVENVAVQLYRPADHQKTLSKNITHAWFPKDAFDEIRWEPAAGGMWVMGRRDRRFPPENPRDPALSAAYDDNRNRKVKDEAPGKGSGYVALYSARGFAWAAEGNFRDRELQAEGHENVFVTIVGDQSMFTSFERFVQAVLDCGVTASVSDMTCSLRIPSNSNTGASGGRFDVAWGSAKVDGIPIETLSWPRFENQYVSGQRMGRVEAAERRWRIAIPPSDGRGPALEVVHDTERPSSRSFNRQVRRVRSKTRPRRSTLDEH